MCHCPLDHIKIIIVVKKIPMTHHHLAQDHQDHQDSEKEMMILIDVILIDVILIDVAEDQIVDTRTQQLS